MDKVHRIHENDIPNALHAFEQYNSIAETISARMNYIVHFCVEIVGGKVEWWDWENDGDSDDKAPGDFMRSYSKLTPDFVQVRGEWTRRSKMKIIDKCGKRLDLDWGEFPLRWLYEDSFEEEYVRGLQLYQEWEANRTKETREVKSKKKQERDALKAAAAAKLTLEERKVLGIK